MAKSLVLASSSIRRSELLAGTGLKFKIDKKTIEEVVQPGLKPTLLAKTISLQKAEAAAPRHPNSIIIAADTFGVLDGKLLGKPHTAEQARKMLRQMSGRSHTVITGFTVMDTGSGKTISKAIETEVYFNKLSEAEIEDYVHSGEPLDKAGAYAIQGLGRTLVHRVDGDYDNVIGLPLEALKKELKKFGVTVPGRP